ncbi:MAG: Rab family GTPase [Promethearchaeota archaeon]
MTADWIFKIIVLGSAQIGKTSFIKGHTQHMEWADLSPSHCIGVDFEVINCILENRDECKLILWDLKSQGRFLELYPYYFNGACGALLIFDVSNRQSFEDLPYWVDYTRNVLGDVPIIVIGTKADLEFDITSDEIERFIQVYDLDGVFFTSRYVRFKKTIIMKQMAKKVIAKYKIPTDEIQIHNNLEQRRVRLIKHVNQVKRAIKGGAALQTEKIARILRRDDIKRDRTIDLTEQEEKDYINFVNYFSICPVCHGRNHESYLKRFYFSGDTISSELKDVLVKLMRKSEEFDEIYYNDIDLGIPCCNCFKQIFKEK